MATIVLRNYLQQIDQLLEEGRFNEATRHCHHILQQYPRHIDTYRALAKAYLEQHQYTEAIDLFQRVLSADPNDFISHVGLAIIHKEESRSPQAVWHMERAFELQPYNAAIREELKALYAVSSGQPPEQIPLTPTAVAQLYAESEMYNLATIELRQLQGQNGDYVGLDVLLAETLWRNDQRMEAVDVCLAVLDRLPHCIPANAILADIWLRTGRLEEAQTYLERLQELLQPTQEMYMEETVVAQAFRRPGAPELPEAIPVEKYDPDDSVSEEIASADADVAPVEEGDYAWLQDLDLDMATETAVSDSMAETFTASDSSLTARLDSEVVEEKEEEDERRIDTDWFKDEPTAVPETSDWLDEGEDEAEVETPPPEPVVEADLFGEDTGTGMQDLPEWLREEDEEMEPLQLSEEEVSEWMIEQSTSSDTGDSDWFHSAEEEEPEPALEAAELEEDWFQDSEPDADVPATAVTAEEEEVDLSWLEETEDEFEPVYLHADEMDDWLAEEDEEELDVAAEEPAEPGEPLVTEDTLDAVDAEMETAATSDWEETMEAEAPEVETGEEGAEPAPDVEIDTGDLPEWLTDGLSSDFGRELEASGTGEISVDEVPDWLMTAQFGESGELTADENVPAWLASAEVTEEPPGEEEPPETETPQALESEPDQPEEDLDLDQLSQAPDLVTGGLEEMPSEVTDDLPEWLRLSETGLSDEVLEPDEPDEIDLAVDEIFGDLMPLEEMGADTVDEVAAADELAETAAEADEVSLAEEAEEDTAVAEESGELTFGVEGVDLDQLAGESTLATDELFAQFAEGEEELPDWLTASEADLGEMGLDTGDLITGDLVESGDLDDFSWLEEEDEKQTVVSEPDMAEGATLEATTEQESDSEEFEPVAPASGDTAVQLNALAGMMAEESDKPASEEADTGLLDWLMSDADESGEMEAGMMGENDERADEQQELPAETPPTESEAPESADEEALDWLQDLAAAADEKPEKEITPEMAELTTGNLPDWLQELSDTESELETAEDISDFLATEEEEMTETATPTDMLDWLQGEEAEVESKTEAEEMAAELAEMGMETSPDQDEADVLLSEEAPAWLEELAVTGELTETESGTEPTFAASTEAEEVEGEAPISEADEFDDILAGLEESEEPEEATEDEIDAVLAELGESEKLAADEEAEEETLAWLDEIEDVSEEDVTKAADWLDELDEAEESEALQPEEDEIDDVLAGLEDEKPDEAPLAEIEEREELSEIDEVEEAMAWLETLEEEEEEALPEIASSDLGLEEPEETEGEEELDWLTDITAELDEEVVKAETPDKEEDKAPALSESATESEELVFPDEAMFPSDVGEPTDVPEELDDTMAWMEQFAAEQGVSLEEEELPEGETAVSEADVLQPESDVEAERSAEEGEEGPQAATAEEAYTAPGAEELVFPDEAMFPRDMGEPTDAPEELDDAMSWLEELASEQGTPIEELPTVADRALPETVVAEEAAAPSPEGEDAEAEPPAEADVEKPKAGSSQATGAAEAYTAAGAEELVFPDEAMFPRDVGEPTDAPEELDDAMAWLEELAGEQGVSMEAEEEAPPSVPAAEEAPPVEEVPQPTPDPLTQSLVALARRGRSDAPDLERLLAETEPASQFDSAATDLMAALDWVEQQMSAPPAEPVASLAEPSEEPDIEKLPEDPEEALAWMEQFAEPDEGEAAPAAPTEAPPQEAPPPPETTAAASSPIDEDWAEMPEDPDEAVAWLEQLADEDQDVTAETEAMLETEAAPGSKGMPEAEAEVAPESETEAEAEAPPTASDAAEGDGGLPQATTAADAYTAAGAEELVFPDEAMFPRDMGAPTDAPEELDDAMAWLEEVAGAQGVSFAEDEETTPPSSVETETAPPAEEAPEIDATPTETDAAAPSVAEEASVYEETATEEEGEAPAVAEEASDRPAETETIVSPSVEEAEEPESFTDLFGEVEDTEETLSWMEDLAGDEQFDTDFLAGLDESGADTSELPPEEEVPPGSLADMVDAVRQHSAPITEDDTPSGLFDDAFDAFLGGPEINLEEELAETWPEWLSSDPEEQPGLGETGWLRSLSESDVASWLAAEEEGMSSESAFDDSFSEPYVDSKPSDYRSDSSSIFDLGGLPAMDSAAQEEGERPSITVSAMELDRGRLETARQEMETGAVETAVDHYQELVKAGQGLSILIADLEQATQRRSEEAAVRRLLGDAYMRNGQLQKALETYREALDMI